MSNRAGRLEREKISSNKKIMDAYWANAKEEKIRDANLEETVYFIIATKGFSDGEKIKLQLGESDFPQSRETKFDGKEIWETVTVKNNKAKVELYLHESWAPMIKEDKGGIIELFWQVTFDTAMDLHIFKIQYESITDLCYNLSEYLLVDHSQRKLYIKPSPIDDEFPEIYSFAGEVMVTTLVEFIEEKAPEKVGDKITEKATQIALSKLEKGYMVTNTGKVYTPKNAKGVQREILNRSISTNEGLVIKTRMGRDFEFMGADNKMVTTRGISQVDHWTAKYFSIRGFIQNISPICDVFELMDWGKAPDYSKPFPIFLPNFHAELAVNLIGMLGELHFSQIEAETKERWDKMLQKSMDEAKLEGLNKVKEYLALKDQDHYREGYRLERISLKTSSNIIQGKYKSITDILMVGEDDNMTTLLYKLQKHPISGEEIAIIDCFFIN